MGLIHIGCMLDRASNWYFYYITLFRTLFVLLYILMTVATPFLGIVVETGPSFMINSPINTLDGVIITIAYLTHVSERFKINTPE